MTSDIARYLNQTIRECHFDPETNAALFFKDNLREIRLTTAVADMHTWAMPNPAVFQKIGCVRYLNVYDSEGRPVWLKETTPGRHLRDLCHYYYRIQQSFVFCGTGNAGSMIDIAYFSFPLSLPYLAANCRPMYYNEYGLPIYGEDWACADAQEQAKCLSTNWLLERWADVVSEGVRAKVYKRISDTERARTCYSLYAQLRRGLTTSEISEIYV